LPLGPAFRVIRGFWRHPAGKFAGQLGAFWWNGQKLLETRLLAGVACGLDLPV